MIRQTDVMYKHREVGVITSGVEFFLPRESVPTKETQQSDSKAPLLIDVTLHHEVHGQHIGPQEKMNFAPALIPCSCSRKGFIIEGGKPQSETAFEEQHLEKNHSLSLPTEEND